MNDQAKGVREATARSKCLRKTVRFNDLQSPFFVIDTPGRLE